MICFADPRVEEHEAPLQCWLFVGPIKYPVLCPLSHFRPPFFFGCAYVTPPVHADSRAHLGPVALGIQEEEEADELASACFGLFGDSVVSSTAVAAAAAAPCAAGCMPRPP